MKHLVLGVISLLLPISFFAQSLIQTKRQEVSKIEISNFVPEIIRSAADPQNPKRILLCLYGWNSTKRRAEVNAFMSYDKGITYKKVLQDTSSQWVSEASCAFGPDGYAYVITGASKRTGKQRGHTFGQMHLFHSGDGGATWKGPTTGHFIDWTAATVDVSASKYRGRLYIFGHDVANDSGKWTGPMKPMIYSSDKGKTVSKPLFTGTWPADGGGYPLAATTNLKGEVLALYRRVNPARLLVSVSKDGGKSLQLLPEISKDSLVTQQNLFDIGFGIDQSNKAFKDRLYISYVAIYKNHPAIMLARSNDNGVSWQHKPIAYYSHDNHSQELGATRLCVNKNGEVAVMWSDLSDSTIKMVVSKTGGDSFESHMTLSKQPYLTATNSQFFENHLQTMGTYEPDAAKNQPPGAKATGVGLSVRILPATFSIIGLTCDADGGFHPFWIEQQPNGYTSLLTTNLQITPKTIPGNKKTIETNNFQNISNKILIDIHSQRYDALRGEISLDFTITNKSDSTIQGPLYLEIARLNTGFGFENPEILDENIAINSSGNPVIELANQIKNGKLDSGSESSRYTIRFKVIQNEPTSVIWQKVQEGETIHPIICEFNLLQ